MVALISCAFYLAIIQIALNALERKLIQKGLWDGEIKDLEQNPTRVLSMTQLIVDIAHSLIPIRLKSIRSMK